MLETFKTAPASLSASELLEIAEKALDENDYEKAIPLLTRIVELKVEQKATDSDIADGYYDVGDKYFLAASLPNCAKDVASAHLLKALHYIKLSIALYPDVFETDIEMCAQLITKIIKQKKKLSLNPSQQSSTKQDAKLLTPKPAVKPQRVKQEQEQDDDDLDVEEESKSSSSTRFRYRDELIAGKLIKSVKVKDKTVSFEFFPSWQDKKHQLGIKKMFIEISRDRALFKAHLKRIAFENPIQFSIVRPLDSNTPEDILAFIVQQAKRESAHSFMKMLRKNKLIKHIEIKDGFAFFHIIDGCSSPEDYFKINTSLYNNYIKNTEFKKYFEAPVKNNTIPKMLIKAPLIGKKPDEVLQQFITIINRKLPSIDINAGEKSEAPVSEEHLVSLVPDEEVEFTYKPRSGFHSSQSEKSDSSQVKSLYYAKQFGFDLEDESPPYESLDLPHFIPEFPSDDLNHLFGVSDTYPRITHQYDTMRPDSPLLDDLLPLSPLKEKFKLV